MSALTGPALTRQLARRKKRQRGLTEEQRAVNQGLLTPSQLEGRAAAGRQQSLVREAQFAERTKTPAQQAFQRQKLKTGFGVEGFSRDPADPGGEVFFEGRALETAPEEPRVRQRLSSPFQSVEGDRERFLQGRNFTAEEIRLGRKTAEGEANRALIQQIDDDRFVATTLRNQSEDLAGDLAAAGEGSPEASRLRARLRGVVSQLAKAEVDVEFAERRRQGGTSRALVAPSEPVPGVGTGAGTGEGPGPLQPGDPRLAPLITDEQLQSRATADPTRAAAGRALIARGVTEPFADELRRERRAAAPVSRALTGPAKAASATAASILAIEPNNPVARDVERRLATGRISSKEARAQAKRVADELEAVSSGQRKGRTTKAERGRKSEAASEADARAFIFGDKATGVKAVIRPGVGEDNRGGEKTLEELKSARDRFVRKTSRLSKPVRERIFFDIVQEDPELAEIWNVFVGVGNPPATNFVPPERDGQAARVGATQADIDARPEGATATDASGQKFIKRNGKMVKVP